MEKASIKNSLINVLTGTATDKEMRSFNYNDNNVLIPKEIYSEFIGKKETDNILRKHGTIITANSELEIPILSKDIHTIAHGMEYSEAEITKVNRLGLTAEILKPIEIDLDIVIRRKLLVLNSNVKQMIIPMLKRAYLKSEKDYMYNGTDTKAMNSGSLFNRAKEINIEGNPIDKIKALRNATSANVRGNSRWIINTHALEYVEDLRLQNGEPMLKTLEVADNTFGANYLLMGFPCDVTDDIKASEEHKALFYFGDLSSFFIFDGITEFKISPLYESYVSTNEIGFNLHHLVDGKLVYSENETTIFKSEIAVE